MSAANSLLNTAGKKLFSRHMEQYRPTDPLYEEHTDARGRVKRRKRELPPGLSQRDLKILRSVNRRAHYLDKGFNLCGLRFGWTFLIGIIPGAGDAADAALGYFLVIRKARQAGIPPWLVQRMLVNLALATSVGLVPFVGDILLAIWRANSRNAALLEEFLRQRGQGNLTQEEATAKEATAKETDKKVGKDKSLAADSTVPAHAGPSITTGAEVTPARSGSGSSRRWMNWRRPSKEKGVPQVATQKRDSRFVEDIDSSLPENMESLS
ncbi:hypothetical protein K488DRAFT_75557 [Vararia minispora EC-137]|uniref:Uncharacterized protein n=1 Tax=Vararia minispora EC-137 TaxID=1314806 RepID=A0ACB8QYU3_9AGAM|nr:hypothetical protein K488DRAFT_75557 [Vararia minispora EC-137]